MVCWRTGLSTYISPTASLRFNPKSLSRICTGNLFAHVGCTSRLMFSFGTSYTPLAAFSSTSGHPLRVSKIEGWPCSIIITYSKPAHGKSHDFAPNPFCHSKTGPAIAPISAFRISLCHRQRTTPPDFPFSILSARRILLSLSLIPPSL